MALFHCVALLNNEKQSKETQQPKRESKIISIERVLRICNTLWFLQVGIYLFKSQTSSNWIINFNPDSAMENYNEYELSEDYAWVDTTTRM